MMPTMSDAIPRSSTGRVSIRLAARRARKRVRRVRARVVSRLLETRATRSTRSVLGTAPAVVSLTSFGTRIDTVHLAIESIAQGTSRPRRLILWLDSIEALENLPMALRRQQARGLEILSTENFGPHKKYYPYVDSVDAFDVPLVTADDDILYPAHWLSGLLEATRRHPDSVIGYWTRRFGFSEDGMPTTYGSWKNSADSEPHPGNVSIGASGVLFPPVMLEKLKERGEAFTAIVPFTDDLWLHSVALRAGIPVRQLSARPVHFLTVPGSQARSLAATNVAGSGNDRAIARLYTRDDLRLVAGVTH